MTSYLGPLGAMVAFKCPSSLRPHVSRPMSTDVTLGGATKAQLSPRVGRTWDVSMDVATPAQLADLAALVDGEQGVGPFAFVDPWAAVTNLMPPSATTFPVGGPKLWGGSAVPGGPVDLADGGRAATSLQNVGGAAGVLSYRKGVTDPFPVVPGVTATGSLYVTGNATVQLIFVDAAGGWVSAPSTVVSNPGPALVRVSVSSEAPTGAVGALLRHEGAVRLTRPAITWTDTVMDWMPGQGAPRVVAPDLSHAVILATSDPRDGGRYTSASFTVREVG